MPKAPWVRERALQRHIHWRVRSISLPNLTCIIFAYTITGHNCAHTHIAPPVVLFYISCIWLLMRQITNYTPWHLLVYKLNPGLARAAVNLFVFAYHGKVWSMLSLFKRPVKTLSKMQRARACAHPFQVQRQACREINGSVSILDFTG